MLSCGIDYRLILNVLAEIYYGVAVVFKQYLYYVLAYVVYIALYRCKHYLALAYRFGIVLCKVRLDNIKTALCNACR